MLVIPFGPEDLAEVRFAISPLAEIYRSVRALDDPAATALHLPWIERTRALVDDLDLDLLRALQPSGVYTPDFIHPPPHTPLAELDDELEQVLATPPDRVRREVLHPYRHGHLPQILQPFVDDPPAALRTLDELVRTYWQRALEPHWARLRDLLEGDILYRARQLADGGARRLFSDIHPELRFDDGALWIVKRFDATVALEGRGLLFVPSAFGWPALAAITEPPWQPTLIYPARGVGTLWAPQRPAADDGLRALLGSRRAEILAALDAPRSTTELARRLEVGPASVSQHLSVMAHAGIVNRHRVGRVVLYTRAPAGEALIGQQGDAGER